MWLSQIPACQNSQQHMQTIAEIDIDSSSMCIVAGRIVHGKAEAGKPNEFDVK
jgi:hypothetical protein